MKILSILASLALTCIPAATAYPATDTSPAVRGLDDNTKTCINRGELCDKFVADQCCEGLRCWDILKMDIWKCYTGCKGNDCPQRRDSAPAIEDIELELELQRRDTGGDAAKGIEDLELRSTGGEGTETCLGPGAVCAHNEGPKCCEGMECKDIAPGMIRCDISNKRF